MQIALAKARDEIDASAEAARLAAARREALEALLADLRARSEADAAAVETAKVAISEAEAMRLADAAALEALREKLAGCGNRTDGDDAGAGGRAAPAEETLTLLAAARAAGRDFGDQQKDAALAAAEAKLGENSRNRWLPRGRWNCSTSRWRPAQPAGQPAGRSGRGRGPPCRSRGRCRSIRWARI
jgi:chemotaxis protein MotB